MLSSNIRKFGKFIIGAVRTTIFVKASAGLLGSLVLFSPFFLDWYDSWNIYSVLREGKSSTTITKAKYFRRIKLEEEVGKTLQIYSMYFLLVGNHGTGKTSLAQHLLRNRNGGIIYVACPDNSLNFGKAFADSIGYSNIYYSRNLFRKVFTSLSILPSSESQRSIMPEFEACKKKFFEAVERYKSENNRVPILIIDDVNNFLSNESSKKFLLELQGFAKVLADEEKLVIVFIASDGQGQDILMKQSCKSRMQIIEISDLDIDETWSFLQFKLTPKVVEEHRIDLQEAITNVTGGRILDLNHIVLSVQNKIPLSKTCNEILNAASADFNSAGMSCPSDNRYKHFWELVSKLLKNNELEDSDVRKMMSVELYEKIRQSNVFSYCDKKKTISFQSVAHKNIAKKHLIINKLINNT